MTWSGFLALSGLVFWIWQTWRAWRFCNAHYKRFKWALSGYKQPRRFSRHG